MEAADRGVRIPLELFRQIGYYFLPPKTFQETHDSPDYLALHSSQWKSWRQGIAALRNLGSTSWTLRIELAPLLKKTDRFIFLTSREAFESTLDALSKNALLRHRVRHIFCDAGVTPRLSFFHLLSLSHRATTLSILHRRWNKIVLGPREQQTVPPLVCEETTGALIVAGWPVRAVHSRLRVLAIGFEDNHFDFMRLDISLGLMRSLYLFPDLYKVAIDSVEWHRLFPVFGEMRNAPQVRELRLKYEMQYLQETRPNFGNVHQVPLRALLGPAGHDLPVMFERDRESQVLRRFPGVKILSLNLAKLPSDLIQPDNTPKGIEALSNSLEVLILESRWRPSPTTLAKTPKLESFIFRNPDVSG